MPRLMVLPPFGLVAAQAAGISVALFLTLMLGSGCRAPAFDRQQEERLVLAAILDDWAAWDSTRTHHVVQGMLLKPPPLLQMWSELVSADTGDVIGALRALDIDRVLARDFVRAANVEDSLPLPLATRLPVTLDTLLPLPKHVRDSLVNTYTFAQRDPSFVQLAYPGARSILTFSHVGFSRNGRQALLYVQHLCGVLCAGGELIVLVKNGPQWTIQARHQVWVS